MAPLVSVSMNGALEHTKRPATPILATPLDVDDDFAAELSIDGAPETANAAAGVQTDANELVSR